MRVQIRDVLQLKSLATKRVLEFKQGERLVGMTRELTDGERLVLAHLDAVLHLLNRSGIDCSSVEVPIEIPDSDPEAEEHEWVPVQEEEPK